MAFILRLLGRFWRGLDGLRKFLHLLVLLTLFAVLLVALHPASPKMPAKAALWVRPSGVLVEQLSGDPFNQAVNQATGQPNPETRVRDLTDAIRAAAKDSRIKVLVLDTRDLTGGGVTKLAQVAFALDEFRASGKKVLSHGGYVSQTQYYLMAHADEIWLEPTGLVALEGFASYRTYFHDLLDKIGVTVNVFKVGTYKSAVEEYTVSKMSPADREQTEAYVKPLWAAYEAAVTKARHLPDGAITAYINNSVTALHELKGDAALMAEQQHLITGRKNRIEFEAMVSAITGEDESTHRFNAVDTAQYLASNLVGDSDESGPAEAKVAVFSAVGVIKDGEQEPGTVGGDTLAELLHDARFDKSVKAVVLRVDSPGGSVQASERIRQEVEALKTAGKPVVASFGSVAASGGYYISMQADEIYAEPTTITGSIGVFAIVPTFEHVLDKVGITTDGVATSAIADAMNLSRPLSAQTKELTQSGVEFIYNDFIQHVAQGRHKTPEQIDAIAQGRVWLATDALDRGLVDHLGTLKEAIAAAGKRAGLAPGKYGISYREKHLGWQESLLRSLRASARVGMANLGLAQSSHPALDHVVGRLDQASRQLANFKDPRGLYLYCNCAP